MLKKITIPLFLLVFLFSFFIVRNVYSVNTILVCKTPEQRGYKKCTERDRQNMYNWYQDSIKDIRKRGGVQSGEAVKLQNDYNQMLSCCDEDNNRYNQALTDYNDCLVAKEDLRQTCISSAWSCGEWSSCSSTGFQIRVCDKILGYCGYEFQSPPTSRYCIYIKPECNSWTYSDWSSCGSDGTKTRKITSSFPVGCENGNPILSQSCLYVPETNIAKNDGNKLNAELERNENSTNLKQEVLSREKENEVKANNTIINRLNGRILLQVEEKGEAWYIEPISKKRYFMGRPSDAFDMMRSLGLGVSENNFLKFEKSGVPSSFSGRILLRVEKSGEAYYVNPVDLKMNFLGRPDDAFIIMRELALGITNYDIRQIPLSE